MGWLQNPAPHVIPISFTTAASGTTTWSDPIRIPAGYNAFTLKWAITGGGRITWVYSISEQYAGDYVIPTGASKIATSGTSITGEAAAGTDAAYFDPEACPFMKIGAVEYTSQATALNAWLILAR
ncbi:MAG: hypothetical protein ABID54_00240 [Pseudomonadota bacterium]